ncbi:MAG: hypothetical protein EZS28_001236 [Streblomastix strix]|uniref:OTU domain-containing protein n=1 Tax=Streblomastix strix TaxID=222440 RepID=A0A5J4X7L6_9EUKA|nr:MAG: hypothetical protein EZS28_001236 [Streblomastix strix]
MKQKRRENTTISASNLAIESTKDAISTATKYAQPSAKLPPMIISKEFIESFNKRPYKRNSREKAKSNIPTDLFLLTEQLEKDGFTIRNNYGAGNCIFHALNDQLSGIYHDVHILWAMIVQNLLVHAVEFRDFFNEQKSLEDYAQWMSIEDDWEMVACLVPKLSYSIPGLRFTFQVNRFFRRRLVPAHSQVWIYWQLTLCQLK